MKTKIKMSKPQYIIKEKDGIVVCKIEANADLEFFETLDLHSWPIHQVMKKKYNNTWYGQTMVFTAVAKLKEGDTWNEVIGKRVAESKCKRNIYHFYCRVYTDIHIKIRQELEIFDEIRDTTFYAYMRETKHFKELMDNEN